MILTEASCGYRALFDSILSQYNIKPRSVIETSNVQAIKQLVLSGMGITFVSPVAARNILSEWLEFLPYNKINGFGGDYCFIDGVYGHQSIARRNIAEVLSDKVERGLFSVTKACEIGKAILYENPAELFGIE